MNYINDYRIFEALTEYDDMMGKILHLYGSIPLPKEKSAIVINKIITSSGNNFNLGDDIEVNSFKAHDKIRFNDYYNSLLMSKDSRGHNFEGLVAGLFDGNLTQRGAKADVEIEGKRLSVKFIDNQSKAPELGSYRNVIEKTPLNDYVVKLNGLTNIFKMNNSEILYDGYTIGNLKEDLWVGISRGVDEWLIAYPDHDDIAYSVIDKETMKQLLLSGCVAAPKGGYKSLYTLALSARFKLKVKKSYIRIPAVTLRDMKNLMISDKDMVWGVGVFGNIAYKMRPDVLKSIKANKNAIIKRLSEM